MSVFATDLPILTFHALDDVPASVASVLPGVFERGIERLCANGYRSIDLMEAVACLRQGLPLPRRSFVITFDDGYDSVYRHAFPVLQRHGLSATIFLTTGESGSKGPQERLPTFNRRQMLSWSEIREMRRAGNTFGAHTVTHPDLTTASPERVRSELMDSKAIIEDALGSEVAAFAYPYGRHDERIRSIVAEHFACACSDRIGLLAAFSDVYAMERVDAYCLRKSWGFGVMLTPPLFPWYLRSYRVLRQLRMAVKARRTQWQRLRTDSRRSVPS